MSWFRRLALSPFIKAHPPRKTQPAPADLIAAYAPLLPASLLELWRQEGLGYYGNMQFALIDPGNGSRCWIAGSSRHLTRYGVFRSRLPLSASWCTTAS